MANFNTLAETTLTNSADFYHLQQGGIDYKQNRETLAAALSSARYTSNFNYGVGDKTTGNDNNHYVCVLPNGPSTTIINPVGDTTGTWTPIALPSNYNIISSNSKIDPIVPVTGATITAGTEVSVGWFANTDIINPDHTDNKWNADSGIIYRDLPIEKGLEFYSETAFRSSIADDTRFPRMLGITTNLIDSPSNIRVYIDFSSATDVFSAKVEVGAIPTVHNVIETGGPDIEKRLVKSWGNFDGITNTIRDGYNFNSVTDSGVGEYIITFTTPFTNTNYSIVATCGGTSSQYMASTTRLLKTTTQCKISVTDPSFLPVDDSQVSFVVLGE